MFIFDSYREEIRPTLQKDYFLVGTHSLRDLVPERGRDSD